MDEVLFIDVLIMMINFGGEGGEEGGGVSRG